MLAGVCKLTGVALLVEFFFTGQRPALELLILSIGYGTYVPYFYIFGVHNHGKH
jgi:hypothetical protein